MNRLIVLISIVEHHEKPSMHLLRKRKTMIAIRIHLADLCLE